MSNVSQTHIRSGIPLWSMFDVFYDVYTHPGDSLSMLQLHFTSAHRRMGTSLVAAAAVCK